MPPRWLETVVAALLPPAVREQVLGDLFERYVSPAQYLGDALRLLPLIVLSRIRRTADGQLSITLALLIYLCYLGAAWFAPAASAGMARLTPPVLATWLGVLLVDAYSLRPYPVLAPSVGTLLALLVEGAPAGLPKHLLLPAAAAALLLASLTRRLLAQEARPWQTAGGRSRPAQQPELAQGASYRLGIVIAILLLVATLRKWGL